MERGESSWEGDGLVEWLGERDALGGRIVGEGEGLGSGEW